MLLSNANSLNKLVLVCIKILTKSQFLIQVIEVKKLTLAESNGTFYTTTMYLILSRFINNITGSNICSAVIINHLS